MTTEMRSGLYIGFKSPALGSPVLITLDDYVAHTFGITEQMAAIALGWGLL